MLVVDDEEQIRRVLRSILRTREYQVDRRRRRTGGCSRRSTSPRHRDPRSDAARHDRHRGLPRTAHLVRGPDPDPLGALRGGRQDRGAGRGRRRLPHQAVLGRRAAGPYPRAAAAGGELHVAAALRHRRRARPSTSPAGASPSRAKQVALTPTEFDILAFLARNVDCVVTQRMILERVWGPEWAEDLRRCASMSATCARSSSPGGPRPALHPHRAGSRLSSFGKIPGRHGADDGLTAAHGGNGRVHTFLAAAASSFTLS